MSTPANGRAGGWYNATREYTLRLVGVRGVSPSATESDVAREVVRLLCEGGLEGAYTESGLDAIRDDPHGRHNAYAFLRGRSRKTVVLLGHIDTVGTADYGALEPLALDPEALARRRDELARIAPEILPDEAEHPGEWMYGRGAGDMKSGDAASIAVVRRLAEGALRGEEPALSVVLLATCDEENESAGVLQALDLLARLREKYDLDYVGAINTDYVTAEYPGDPHRYVYLGTIGKLLPAFYVIGASSHAGDPFDGMDANLIAADLIRAFSMNPDLCESAGEQRTTPPVTLHAADLKDSYDTQLPFASFFYLNLLTLTSGPAEWLARLRTLAEETLRQSLARVDAAERTWRRDAGIASDQEEAAPRTGRVLTYAELLAETEATLGREAVRAALAEEDARWPADLDKRMRCAQLVRRLWALSGQRGPAVVLLFAPPYYPHVAPQPCPLTDAIDEVIAAHPGEHLATRDYFPLLSDMSYLRLDPSLDLTALAANMPVWQAEDETPRSGAYRLPLSLLRSLDIPVVDLGPYGKGAHQAGERLLMPFAFETVPQLLWEVLERLGEKVTKR